VLRTLLFKEKQVPPTTDAFVVRINALSTLDNVIDAWSYLQRRQRARALERAARAGQPAQADG